MNEEKQIAQAIMDAQKMHEESHNGRDYTRDITDCLLETCKKHGLSDNLWALLDLAMHWWNDIQCWADDIMADKNILDECRLPPQPDDIIELTEKGIRYRDTKINLCDTCVCTFGDCDGEPEFGNGIGNDNVIKCDSHAESE